MNEKIPNLKKWENLTGHHYQHSEETRRIISNLAYQSLNMIMDNKNVIKINEIKNAQYFEKINK